MNGNEMAFGGYGRGNGGFGGWNGGGYPGGYSGSYPSIWRGRRFGGFGFGRGRREYPAWGMAPAGRMERPGRWAKGFDGTEGMKAREEICRLLDYFPQLRVEEVPKEAWAMAREGEDLTLSFCFCRMKQLEEMLARRERNAALSTGSMGSMGSMGGGGTLAAFWDAYEV